MKEGAYDRPLKIGIIGSGHRGRTYINELTKIPEEAVITAVCDTSIERMNLLTDRYKLTEAKKLTSLDEMLSGDLVDAVIITVPDSFHRWAAEKSFAAGKDVLMEKPLAPTASDCRAILKAHRKSGKLMQVGFVLRNTNFYLKVKEILDGGSLGQIMFMHAAEYLGVQHGTSFMTRWHRKKKNAGTFLLAKCSHDLDILNWLTGSKPEAVSSFGGTDFFVPGRGGAKYCSDCSRAGTCPYKVSTEYYFIEDEKIAPRNDLCAFNDDKDVIDNQVVILQYANKIRATFELQLFHQKGTRRITVGGQNGYLDGDFEENRITVKYNNGRKDEIVEIKSADESGHGGGDLAFTRSFLEAIRTRKTSGAGAEAGLAANVIADAIERSRLKMKTVRINQKEYKI